MARSGRLPTRVWRSPPGRQVRGPFVSPRDLIVDPACGDGSFLRGIVAAVAGRFGGTDRTALARTLATRIFGFDIDAEAVVQARRKLSQAFREYLGADVPEDIVYAATKAIVEDADKLSQIHAALADFDPKQAADPTLLGNCPLHPGAERYYKEAGLL